jgi:threonine/homoserine/homoserine lactone efflux protein
LDIINWLQIVLICILGAISPGPSLAAVISNTTSSGRFFGVTTGIGHGIGITLWASITAVGISEMIVNNPNLLATAQLLGACLLGYIGYRTIGTSITFEKNLASTAKPHLARGLSEGFMIALLNPKIALFFLAIFSQFIIPNSNWVDTAIMGITAGVIDAGWYILVAIVISRALMPKVMQKKSLIIAKINGILLILISLYLLIITFTRVAENHL